MDAPRRILITGGVRSGKSRYAVELARQIDGERVFLATAEDIDGEMAQKIERHERDRDGAFTTVEEPVYVARAIDGLKAAPKVIVIDCLTFWVNNLIHHLKDAAKIDEQKELLVNAVRRSLATVIMVTNEVGMGIMPAQELSRDFMNRLGFLNQDMAAICHECILMVSGLPQQIKG